MNIVIAGVGEVVRYLAKMFSVENHNLTIIDDNETKLNALSEHYDLMTVYGSATSIEDLNKVNIKNADLFVAVTSHESNNLTSCALAYNLGAKTTLARVDSKEYILNKNKERFNDLGIKSLVYPELLTAQEIVKSLNNNWQRINMSFCNDSLLLLAVKLRDNTDVLNKEFKTGFMDHGKFRITAIKRSGDTFIPKGDDKLLSGDIVYLITTPEELEYTRIALGKENRPIRRVMIMGGSRIGINTAQLLPRDVSAKIIEINPERAEKIANLVPDNVMILNMDARDLESLKEEGIENTDAFVAVTGSSDTNILACLAAKRFGIVKTIAEIENNDYIPLALNLDIGTIVNKKLITASHIYQLTLDKSVLNVTCVPLSDAQVVEFEAVENSKVTKHKLRDLNIPSDVNFGGYVRNGKGYLCYGNTEIQVGDHVIVFCLATSIHAVEQLFHPKKSFFSK
jgi:trk system potassium uptake protein TrkA